MAGQLQRPCINISTPPDISVPEMNFYDTSFFQTGNNTQTLPTPEEVMKRPKSGIGRGIRRFDDLKLAVEIAKLVASV
jgi:hypothetical protein